jgi:serine/threonine protein phosphatase PrpC
MWNKTTSKRFLPADIGRRFRGSALEDPAGVRTSRSAGIPRVRFDGYGQSERGTLRRVNEDQFFTMPLGSDRRGINYLLGVADGIGGAPGGEKASSMAVETFQQFVREERDRLLRTEKHDGEIIQTLTRGLNRCQGELQQFVEKHPEYTGMGTTMTAALVLWPHLYLVHMGNARAFLLRQGTMKPLTHDHTYGQALLDAGVLNESTFKTSSMKNILSTFLGDHLQEDPEVHPDIRVELLHPGDTLLFSTNGLTHAVPEEMLLNILKHETSSQDLCQKLMDCARERQSKDDATALVARFVDVLATPRRPEARE